MADKNPIERELSKLDEQWEDFISADQAIFCWRIKSDEQQLSKTFVRLKEQFLDDSSDLFIGLHSDFLNENDYSFEITEEMNQLLHEGFEQAIRDEQQNNETAINEFTWNVVDLSGYSHGHHALLDNCQRVLDAFGKFIDCLVLVIMPNQVAHLDSWLQWWRDTAEIHKSYDLWPEKLKLLVFEIDAAPHLSSVVDEYAEQFYCANSSSNMKQAIDAILENADDGSPGAKIRILINDMQYAVGEQNIKLLQQCSETALAIAVEQSFFEMAATVLMIRAAGYLNAQYFQQAVADYQQAQLFSLQGIDKEIPGCDKLLLQSQMLEGTAFFSANQYAEAAACYQKTADLAAQQNNTMIIMEAWRMSSFCFERNKQKALAWEDALKALAAAKELSPEEQQASTLPFVGDALLRVSPNVESEQQITEEMIQLLGEDWLEKLQEVKAAC